MTLNEETYENNKGMIGDFGMDNLQERLEKLSRSLYRWEQKSNKLILGDEYESGKSDGISQVVKDVKNILSGYIKLEK